MGWQRIAFFFYPGKGWISVNQAAVLTAGNKK
jgi:hypothetical protein